MAELPTATHTTCPRLYKTLPGCCCPIVGSIVASPPVPHSCFIVIPITCHRGWLSFHLFSCTYAYTAGGTSNTRLIFPRPIRFGRDSSLVRRMKCSGFSLSSIWHTITPYLEEIQFFYKSCISINCVLPLFPIHVQREGTLRGFQSRSHFNIAFHLYPFQLSKLHSV